jgi:very-short-patch-repair endonuclease
MRPKLDNADAAIAVIAAKQHGIVTLTQLIQAGLSRSGVKRRVAAGRLHRLYRGVYAVGHRGLSNEGRWMAAVLACGPGAVLSHRAAAEHWALLEPTRGIVDVTVPGSGGRGKRPGLRIHRSYLLGSSTTRRDGIAVTAPGRTLVDLRRSVAAPIYRRARRQAEFRGLDLEGLDTDGTRSEPESDFLRLCRRHRVPDPEVNVRIGRYTVDFLWRRERLVVEVDGWAAHRGRQAFEDDHQRDLELRALGLRVLRFTARQVQRGPAAVATAVLTKLGV